MLLFVSRSSRWSVLGEVYHYAELYMLNKLYQRVALNMTTQAI